MKVRVPNALTINTFGGEVPFPAVVSVRHPGAPLAVYLTGIRLVDLLRETLNASAPVMVFAVDRNDYESIGDDIRTLSVDEALDELQIRPLARDDDAFVLLAGDAVRLFDSINHYNAKVIDGIDATAELADPWVTAQGHNWFTEGPVLQATRQPSTLYADAHDDCYVYVESRAPEAKTLLAGLLLASAVGTSLLKGTDGEIDVALPSAQVVSAMFGDSGAFSVDQRTIEASEHRVKVPYARSGWHLGDDISPPDGTVTYAIDSGVWTTER